SGDLLVMLILGGVGRLYGAFVGPVVYLIAQDYLAKQYPEYWYFGIGVLLVIVVLFARGGILGIVEKMSDKWLPALSRQTSSAKIPARGPPPTPPAPARRRERSTRSPARTARARPRSSTC